ncbi:MAG: sigma-54-dependent Fis family transcriptional regulator [Planctomycetes bacterium]|nr:sigma-54-dependent Fis family transcriptional regulator [Planctomycetota bacterium]
MSKKKPVVLVVDDDRDIRTTLDMLLGYEGFEVRSAASAREALARLAEAPYDAVLLDIKMPERDGLDLLPEVRERHPRTAVVMISGHGDIRTAVEAVRRGAADFLEKPLDGERVVVSLRNALARRRLEEENRALREELLREHQLLGESPAMRRVLTTIEKVARSDARVLITGENGTGKELIARRIHALGERARGPFVPVNCAAIPDELVESELFGHRRGAFTGATADRIGRFEAASGGTLFLDEIGEMTPEAQAKVLRALESGEISPVGAEATVAVDLRVVAATNRDLKAEVAAGSFREDLYYRLAVVPIHAPALRERLEDLSLLAQEFLAGSCRAQKCAVKRLAPAALDYLRTLPWPGNVRELRNLVERLVVLLDGPEISANDVRELAEERPRAAGADVFACATFEEFRAAAEAEFLRRKLAEHGFNKQRTAEQIGMPRSNLYKKLDRYGLK